MTHLQTQISELAGQNESTVVLWTTFKDNLKSSINANIPHKTALLKESVPWITPEIKRLVKKRDHLHKIKMKSNDQIKTLRATKQVLQNKIRQVYWSYIKNMITPPSTDTDRQNSTKRFWTFIKHKKKDNTSIIGLISESKLHSDCMAKANILDHQFQSAFTKNTQYSEEQFKTGGFVQLSNQPTAPDITITCNSVEKVLNTLNRISPRSRWHHPQF